MNHNVAFDLNVEEKLQLSDATNNDDDDHAEQAEEKVRRKVELF